MEQKLIYTKFGIKRGRDGAWLGISGSPEYVQACCNALLKRLNTDYIDLYYQHRPDPEVPLEETIGAMAELVQAGKIRYLGLSEASAEELEKAHHTHTISALQTELSLWSRDVEKNILPKARQLGIGFVAYSPLGRGFLTGAIKQRDDLEQGDWRLSNPRFSKESIANNQKLSIFFLAFFPLFVNPNASSPTLNMVLLSLMFMAMTLVIFIFYGFSAKGVRRYVVNSPRLIGRLQR